MPADYDDRAAAARAQIAGKPSKFPFEFASEMTDDDTSTRWRLDGLIEDRTVNLLFGPKDCFKSFVALAWGMSVATGNPWLGRATAKGPFVYVCGEGHRGIRRRMKAWAVHQGLELSKIQAVRSLWPMQVLDDVAMLQWQNHIREVVERFREPPGIIVVDTLATNFGRGNQNDPSDMSRFIANIRIYLVGEFACPVLVVHHQGKNAELGARGGSSIEADADAVFTLARLPDNETVVRLHTKHIKDDGKPGDILLSPRVVDLGPGADGQPQSSLVLEPYATEIQVSVLGMLREGRSHRDIAAAIGKDKRQVGREVERLRAAGVWG